MLDRVSDLFRDHVERGDSIRETAFDVLAG